MVPTIDEMEYLFWEGRRKHLSADFKTSVMHLLRCPTAEAMKGHILNNPDTGRTLIQIEALRQSHLRIKQGLRGWTSTVAGGL